MSYYYTYRITCLHPNSDEKYYYGFRKTECLPENDNYWSSSKYVKIAIKKYGKSQFKKKVLKVFSTPEKAIEHESFLHEKLQVDKNPLFFNRCKSTKWGYRVTGLILSGKTYEEIHGEEKAKQLRETRSLQMKERRKINNVEGENNPNYGKKWSSEKRKAFSNNRQGASHPSYGLMWINDGTVCKKINKTHKIPEGWQKGRIRTWKNQYGK